MLRATTACTFSTSQLPKVVRTWCVLYILTWKCASRHNGAQFFISHLASWLRTRRFSEPTFGPSGAPNHWKNTVFRDFPTFSRICIFFLLTLLSSNLSLLSASSLLCSSSVHIVGSLTSKLPSITYHWDGSPVQGGRLGRLPMFVCYECRPCAAKVWKPLETHRSLEGRARTQEESRVVTPTYPVHGTITDNIEKDMTKEK